MVEPPQAGSLPTVIAPRQFDAVDEFARALTQAGASDVTVIEATLDAAPADGYLIVFGTREIGGHRALASRTILINADRASVLKILEDTAALGAVEKQRYFRWRSEPEHENGTGLFARKDLLGEFGATPVAGPFRSERYALCRVTGCSDLPSLLVAYLKAHSRVGEPPRRW